MSNGRAACMQWFRVRALSDQYYTIFQNPAICKHNIKVLSFDRMTSPTPSGSDMFAHWQGWSLYRKYVSATPTPIQYQDSSDTFKVSLL